MNQQETMPMSNPTICFYLQDGVEALDFAGPLEAFAVAGFPIFTVSKTEEPIRSQGVLKIVPEYSIANAPKADIIVVFGGSSWNAYNDPDVVAWIRSRADEVSYFLSVCSGAFILAKAGLLDGLRVTTFHKRIEELRVACPNATVVANVRFVDNGRIITTAGVSAGIDGALHLIGKLKGDKVLREVVTYMEYDKWNPNDGLIMPAK
jgi:transcriptional regulator GlxA family with amidase domain